eukprot:8067594-Pyramimonas_sp.AAC.1
MLRGSPRPVVDAITKELVVMTMASFRCGCSARQMRWPVIMGAASARARPCVYNLGTITRILHRSGLSRS